MALDHYAAIFTRGNGAAATNEEVKGNFGTPPTGYVIGGTSPDRTSGQQAVIDFTGYLSGDTEYDLEYVVRNDVNGLETRATTVQFSTLKFADLTIGAVTADGLIIVLDRTLLTTQAAPAVTGQTQTLIKVLPVTQSSLTITGYEVNSLTLTVTKASLTAGGNALLLSKSLPIAPGTATATGTSLDQLISSSWQYTTVTSTSLYGVETTLFNILDGVTPAIGDIFRLPRASSDGGAVTGYGNGRFSIGSPTSGPDTLEGVMYYDKSANTWLGPITVSIQSATRTLRLIPARVSSRGALIQSTRERLVVPGSLALTGKIQRRDNHLPFVPVSLTYTSKNLRLNGGLQTSPGTLTAAGQTITLDTAALKLYVETASLLAGGNTVLRDNTLLTTQASLTAAGDTTLRLYGSKPVVERGNLFCNGRSIGFLQDTNPLAVRRGVATASGNTITLIRASAQPNLVAAAILGL